MKHNKWPPRVWEAVALSDCLLILAVGATKLPYPPDGITATISVVVLGLAFLSAIAYGLSI